MSIIIDRRLNDRKKNAVNRARFLRRYKEQIRRAVDDLVSRRSITDMEQGGDVKVPVKDISEPAFRHGSGGDRDCPCSKRPFEKYSAFHCGYNLL